MAQQCMGGGLSGAGALSLDTQEAEHQRVTAWAVAVPRQAARACVIAALSHVPAGCRLACCELVKRARRARPDVKAWPGAQRCLAAATCRLRPAHHGVTSHGRVLPPIPGVYVGGGREPPGAVRVGQTSLHRQAPAGMMVGLCQPPGGRQRSRAAPRCLTHQHPHGSSSRHVRRTGAAAPQLLPTAAALLETWHQPSPLPARPSSLGRCRPGLAFT